VGATWDNLVTMVRAALVERATGATLAELCAAAKLPETTVREALLDLVATEHAEELESDDGVRRWVAATPTAAPPQERPKRPPPRRPSPAPKKRPPIAQAATHRTSPERWTYIARRFVEGASICTIARELGVTPQAISYYRRQLLPPRAPIPRDLEARARAHVKRLEHVTSAPRRATTRA
jgi:transposase-like protein